MKTRKKVSYKQVRELGSVDHSKAENDGFGEADANLADTETERKRVLDGIPGLRGSELNSGN